MIKDKEVKCCICNELKPIRKVGKIANGIYKCFDCIRKKRKEHREFLKREICGIRKREGVLREAKEKREKILKIKPEPKPQKIKGEKIKRNSRQLHFYLTREEKQLLFKKYIKKGYSYEQSDEKVKEDVKYLSNLVTLLREKQKSEGEINGIFKESFSRLVELKI